MKTLRALRSEGMAVVGGQRTELSDSRRRAKPRSFRSAAMRAS